MSAIMTYTGTMFDPLNPQLDQIDSRDIAHALSMLCRANGHFKSFYSVGQHCVNCMQEAAARGYSRKVQLACLLHDASEAYLSDITRPVKQKLPQYLEIEKPLQEAILNKYLAEPLTQEEWKQVQDIDDAMLYHEFLALMDSRLAAAEPVLHSKPEFRRFLLLGNTVSAVAFPIDQGPCFYGRGKRSTLPGFGREGTPELCFLRWSAGWKESAAVLVQCLPGDQFMDILAGPRESECAHSFGRTGLGMSPDKRRRSLYS